MKTEIAEAAITIQVALSQVPEKFSIVGRDTILASAAALGLYASLRAC